MENVTLSTKVKDWYTDYFKDQPGEASFAEDMNPDATFQGVLDCLKNEQDFYDYINVGDSVVRENIFEQLAEILDKDYDYVYYLWLYGEKGKKEESKEIKTESIDLDVFENVDTLQDLQEVIDNLYEQDKISDDKYSNIIVYLDERIDSVNKYIEERSKVTNTDEKDIVGIMEDNTLDAIENIKKILNESKEIKTEDVEQGNTELQDELLDYMFTECDLSVNYNNEGVINYIPDDLEHIQYYFDGNTTQEDLDKVTKQFKDLIANAKFYLYRDAGKIYIQLSDNHTLFQINNDKIDMDTYAELLTPYFETFEEDTGVELLALGRSGRHICVQFTLDNLKRYDELKQEQQQLEQEFIEYVNSYKPYEDEEDMEESKEVKVEDKTEYTEYKDINKEEKLTEDNDKMFSGIEFEKLIPHEMRFKEYNIIDDTLDLFWVTQQVFTLEDLKEFYKAFIHTGLDKAYVTVRDFSTYEWNADMNRKVLAVVTKDGFNATDYMLKCKEAGWLQDSDKDESTWVWIAKEDTLEESAQIKDLKQIISNAKNAAKRDGYDQYIYIDADGDYSITRLKDDSRQLVGKVEYQPKAHETGSVKYIPAVKEESKKLNESEENMDISECEDKLREISDSIYEYAKDIQVDPVEPFKEAYEDIANKIEKLADELINVWENGVYQGKDLQESKKLNEDRLGNNTFTDADEAEYYRNKELYANSGLARHKEAMEKAKEACKEKGIEVDETRGVYESVQVKQEPLHLKLFEGTIQNAQDVVDKFVKIGPSYYRIFKVTPNEDKFVVSFASAGLGQPGGDFEPATLDEIKNLQLYVEDTNTVKESKETIKISEDELKDRYEEFIKEVAPEKKNLSYEDFKTAYLRDTVIDGKHLELEESKQLKTEDVESQIDVNTTPIVYMNTWKNYNQYGADLTMYGNQEGWMTIEQAKQFSEEHKEDSPFINDLDVELPFNVDEYSSVDIALDEIQEYLSLDESAKKVVDAIFESYSNDYEDVMQVYKDDNYTYLTDIKNTLDLGYEYVQEMGLPSDAMMYFDTDEYKDNIWDSMYNEYLEQNDLDEMDDEIAFDEWLNGIVEQDKEMFGSDPETYKDDILNNFDYQSYGEDLENQGWTICDNGIAIDVF